MDYQWILYHTANKGFNILNGAIAPLHAHNFEAEWQKTGSCYSKSTERAQNPLSELKNHWASSKSTERDQILYWAAQNLLFSIILLFFWLYEEMLVKLSYIQLSRDHLCGCGKLLFIQKFTFKKEKIYCMSELTAQNLLREFKIYWASSKSRLSELKSLSKLKIYGTMHLILHLWQYTVPVYNKFIINPLLHSVINWSPEGESDWEGVTEREALLVLNGLFTSQHAVERHRDFMTSLLFPWRSSFSYIHLLFSTWFCSCKFLLYCSEWSKWRSSRGMYLLYVIHN